MVVLSGNARLNERIDIVGIGVLRGNLLSGGELSGEVTALCRARERLEQPAGSRKYFNSRSK